MIRRRRGSSRREPTIALINVVFLMLVFFLVAGTIAPPMSGDLSLVRTRDLDRRAPPDALVAHADGHLTYRRDPVASAAAFARNLSPAEQEAVRVVPDRDLPAAELVRIATELRAGGAGRVLIVTEQGLE